MQVLPPTGYSLDTAAREITLLGPWKLTSKAQIVKIFNLTTNDLLYDPNNRARLGVSVTDGVILYDYTTGAMQDTDELLIIVEAQIPSITQMVMSGELFRNAHKFDILDDSLEYLLIKTGNAWTHIYFDIMVDGDTHVELYHGATYSDIGTREYSGNFNFNFSTHVADVELYYNSTITDEGTYMANLWAFGGSGSVVATATHAAASTIPTEVVLTPNSIYLIKINNMAGRDIQAFYQSRFYETVAFV